MKVKDSIGRKYLTNVQEYVIIEYGRYFIMIQKLKLVGAGLVKKEVRVTARNGIKEVIRKPNQNLLFHAARLASRM